MPLSTDAVITLVILTAAIVLFLTNWIRADVVALLVLISLGVTGVLTVEEAFSGFSRSAVVTIVAIYVLAAGLNLTGAGERVGNWLGRAAGESEGRLVVLVMVGGAFLSLFMNNIAAAAVLLPGVSSAARHRNVNPARLLMPLAFATILGGMATLFTSTNIVSSGLLAEAGLDGFSVLSFAPVGIPVVIVGVLYMAVVGRRILHERPAPEQFDSRPPDTLEEDLAEIYRLDERLFRARIPPGSYLDHRSLAESTLRELYNVSVMAVERDGRKQLAPSPDTILHAGDVVTLEGSLDEFRGRDVEPYLEILNPTLDAEQYLESVEITTTEVALAPRSSLIGHTLQEVNFREQFGFSALAIWRGGRPIRRATSSTPLLFGDALLLQGPRARIHLLRRNHDLIMLGEPAEPVADVRSSKLGIATAIMVGTLVLAATGLLETAEAMVLGALTMVLVGVLSPDEAYDAVEWRSVVLVAGMLPMGLALTNTGLAAAIADNIMRLTLPYGPLVLFAALFLLSALLVQVISGPAVAAIVVPLAIESARQAGIDPWSLTLGVAMGASMAFLTPLGHPVNVLVMGPGGYRFGDYTRVGLPLALLVTLVILILLPIIYPF
ncbi:MAG: anion permease [Anaerolineae bacterium]|nr:anion permease [Anaerolineae bacterium]